MTDSLKEIARLLDGSGIQSALEASRRHQETLGTLIRPDAGIQAFLDAERQHKEMLASLLQPTPGMQALLDAERRHRDQLQALLVPSAGVQALLDAQRNHDETMRAMLGPADELRRLATQLAEIPESSALAFAKEMACGYEQRFGLPSMTDLRDLVATLNPFPDIANQYSTSTTEVLRAMESMHAPWLDSTRPMESLGGFAALHGMGRALKAQAPFDQSIADSLRQSLGDWRDTIQFPADIFSDLTARTGFYIAAGLDTRLTDFPAPAFREGLERAEIVIDLPAGDPDAGNADAELESGFARTNAAHDRLQRLEYAIREFIDRLMASEFGKNWPAHCLPNGMVDTWQKKKEIGIQNGDDPSLPLVAYADFADYHVLICKRDNWKRVFSGVFKREESVRESFQRLQPIRVCTMHSRVITQDDELYLHVEVRRLLGAISRGPKA